MAENADHARYAVLAKKSRLALRGGLLLILV